jgi:hypothetical protein
MTPHESPGWPVSYRAATSRRIPRLLPPPPALPPATPSEAVAVPAARRKGGKVGKYRDPNYHHYGFYLRTTTHKQVKRRLEDTQPDKDISELMQELLEQWLKDS